MHRNDANRAPAGDDALTWQGTAQLNAETSGQSNIETSNAALEQALDLVHVIGDIWASPFGRAWGFSRVLRVGIVPFNFVYVRGMQSEQKCPHLQNSKQGMWKPKPFQVLAQ